MLHLSKSVLAVGAVVLAGGLMSVMNPKTVHAVAAALVQVTNTASNPVVTQSVGAQAENLVHLVCSSTLSEISTACVRYAPDGSTISNFTVPAGKFLVITGVDVLPTGVGGCPGPYSLALNGVGTQPGGFYLELTTANGMVTTHFTYPSGTVIGAGITPVWGGFSAQACPGGQVIVDMFGYLTAA
jgi:hypothetical protein